MADEHKRGGWRTWSVVMVLLVLYVLSCGPAVWILQKCNPEPQLNDPWSEAYLTFYKPLDYGVRLTGTEEWFQAYIDWFSVVEP